MPRAALALLVLLLSAPAAEAEIRYAAVGASGLQCTQAAPCPFATALLGATSGDEVVVGPGTYTGGDLDNSTLEVPDGVDVRGAVVGPGRPVLTLGLYLDGAGTSVRDVELRRSGSEPTVIVANGAVADRVVARQLETAGGADACGALSGGTLRNSLCIESGPDHFSGSALDGGDLRNVTSIGAAYGLYSTGLVTVEAVIAQGGNEDDVYNIGANEFRDVLYVTGTGPDSDTDRISAAPTFRGADDFRQGAGSVTIDAGDLEDATTGPADLDLNGNLRKLGTHVDVGAYEHVPTAPAAVAGAKTSTTADGATFAGTIQTGGARADVQFEYGPGFGSTTPVQSIPASLQNTQVTATVTGLGDAPTPYRLKVTTDGGTDTSDPQTAYRAPSLTAGDPTAITQTTATLNGSVALKGAPESKVEFVYGAATSPPQTVTSDGAVKADLTGLSPGTTYQWKLRVTREGEFFETAVATFTTAATGGANATPSPSASPAPSPSATPGTSFSVGATPAKTRRAGKLLLRGRALVVRFRCGDAACGVRASGAVRIGTKRYGTLAAPKQPLQLGAGERGAIRLTANRRLRKRVRAYLKRHRKAKAAIRLRGVFTDADGARIVRKLTIRTR